MRIKKVSQTVPTTAQVVDGYSNSTTDSYSCNYVNGIIESGSNSYGYYTKYIDGTMICTRKVTVTIASLNSWGTLYDGSTSEEVKFAQSFIESPTVSVTPTFSAFVEKAVPSLTGITSITLARPTSTANWNVPLDIIAIGKWK